jgi:hypothetical protein
MTGEDSDSHGVETATRQTAMMIFRDEGVDWAALAADGRG